MGQQVAGSNRRGRRQFLKQGLQAGILTGTGLAALSTSGLRHSQTAQATPQQGGTMVVVGHQEVPTLSPGKAVGNVPLFVIYQLYNGLVEVDENFEVQPALAESWQISADGLTYTFKLRQGVKFHDGEDFTAEDVKYTYEFYGDPDSGSTLIGQAADIESIDIPDDYTVVFTLKQPNATFLRISANNFYIVPKHYHEEVGEEVFETQPIGTGPFKLKEWRAAEFTELEAFEEHFRGRPNIDILRQDIVPEASVRAIALETGQADSMVWPPLIEDNLRFEADTENYTTFKTPSLSVNHFPLNNNHPILSDKRVRQAMMYAFDRPRQIQDVQQGAAVLATSNLSPSLVQWYTELVTRYEYDPNKAVELLEEAGWTVGADGIREKDGQKFTFTCTTITGDQARRPQAEILQQQLRAVGIDMQLSEAPITAIQTGLRNNTVDASLYNWNYGGTNGDPDAPTTLGSDGRSNWSNFKNARVDELLDLGRKEVDPEKRAEYYREIQQIVADEVPFLFVMYWDWFTIFSSRIKGLPESALISDFLYKKCYQFWIEA
ncbi:ABC transporter substrate-binding protein [Thermostichus vulcanus]|uniref:ABC transporter substrate-binding protein n=1 Tax=Thermostichus vulcanus str. 'Rupite' TaxID=2813851 RepID=A0ABT0CBG3_THEVL|nr:ABC transporter substrate-binding protein [Thermostichus vulcanus]MCJ2543044.1 ABC transporter substrate-binding protein [Thermostichus vulcanus str. 'Rupite']